MAANTSPLTRPWIQFLKNNQITASQSDPNSGKLTYKRKVTTDDVIRFLTAKTDYDEDTINDAIYSVLTKQGQDGSPARLQAPPDEPEQQNQPSIGIDPDQPEPNRPRKYSNDDAEDVEYKEVPRSNEPRALSAPPVQQPKARGGKKAGEISQTPNAIRKRAARSKARQAINEDFVDKPTELNEKDVEDIFTILQSGAAKQPDQKQSQQQQDPEQTDTPDTNKIKNLIKKGMNVQQRRGLWRALHEGSLNEAQISKNDADRIFKNVAQSREHGFLKAGKIDINDLQKAWKKSGFSLDTNDIGRILHSAGYDEHEINGVFDQVLGDDDYDYNDETDDQDDDVKDTSSKPSPAVIKIADYIKKHNLQDEIIAFMEQEFGDELTVQEPDRGLVGKAMNWAKNKFGRKATVEDVRQIFSAMVLKERSMLNTRIKEQQQIFLGRSKK